MTTETCDYCDAPMWGFQNGGRSKTCEQHVLLPFEEMKEIDEKNARMIAVLEAHGAVRKDSKWRACVDCEEEITVWWEDGEGDAYCAGCYTDAGFTCDGCHNEQCVQCNEEEDETGPCAGCGSKTNFMSCEMDCGGFECEDCANRETHVCRRCETDSEEEEETEEQVKARLRASVAYWEEQLKLGTTSVEYGK